MKTSVLEPLNVSVHGHVKILDRQTGEVLVDKPNAVHPQNMSRAIARALAGEQNGQVYKMALGNGGTNLDIANNVIYLPPNTTGVGARLYNQTYEEVVSSKFVDYPPDELNSVVSASPISPSIWSMTITTCVLSMNEPAGQALAEQLVTNINDPYIFDELGLMTEDGLLITHLIFAPLLKHAGREIEIVYTLTIAVA